MAEESAKLTVSKTEMELLGIIGHGTVKPDKEQVETMKSLYAKKLVEHIGNGKFKTSKIGLFALSKGEEMNKPTTTAKASPKPVMGKAEPKEKKKNPFIKPKKSREEVDAEYTKKYKHYVKGSVSKDVDEEHGKRTALIKCACGKTRKVFTSDVFQVKKCLECKKKGDSTKLAKLKGKK